LLKEEQTINQIASKYGVTSKIFNIDQGNQYRSSEHIKILKENDIKISMNERDRSIDNSY
jgi:putative transposase